MRVVNEFEKLGNASIEASMALNDIAKDLGIYMLYGPNGIRHKFDKRRI